VFANRDPQRGAVAALPGAAAARACIKYPAARQVRSAGAYWKVNALSRGPMAETPATRASLLVRLRDPRDADAWAQFLALYAPVVYGYARKQGLQDADAADLCQDVLTAVAGAIGRLEYDPARGAFRNWLFTVVRRRLATWRRAARRRPANDPALQQALELQPAPPAEEEAWEAEWEEQLFAWACAQVRPHVTDVTWQAFWRTAIEEQPGKQVATDLGLSLAAVYRARSRVLARLKEQVQSAQEP
jgi:RNA polymerase sigma-70 factor (ECF subfamily)